MKFLLVLVVLVSLQSLVTGFFNGVGMRRPLAHKRIEMVIQGDRELRKSIRSSLSPSIAPRDLSSALSKVESRNDGKQIAVTFEDGSSYLFHSLWLRDACRDLNHVVPSVGERQLTATAAMLGNPEDLSVKELLVAEDGQSMDIVWDNRCEMIEEENSVWQSTFTASMPRLLVRRWREVKKAKTWT